MANAAEQIRQHLMHGRLRAANAVLKSLEAVVEGHAWFKEMLQAMRDLPHSDQYMAQKEFAYSRAAAEQSHGGPVRRSVYC